MSGETLTGKRQHLCSAKGGCIAVVSAVGDLCPAHYDACHFCGYPRRMHPVTTFTNERGPVMHCYDFQHQGMKESEAQS